MAIVTAISSVGTCMAFSSALPGDELPATYAALTWIEWEGITTFGDLGGTDDVAKVTPVCSGVTQKIHGPRDNGTQNMDALYDSAHAAQILVKNAYDVRSRVAVRLTLPNADVLYYIAIVTSAAITPGSASDALMMKPTLDITSDIVEG